ncbi:MAG: BOX elements [uncultured Sulfurovum sp.]|uniref:BOX elements n=1 Tax=uncultured Sulfurovum sp. TaxID=269237 RepID=A0A6S6TF05_9BACT|nr:MAG: BOX elements [uncultured Sulfurovum sp.]
MKIINPTYIYLDNTFQENLAVAFNAEIQAIDTLENLQTQYPEASVEDQAENSVLYPGFINTHVHLEFSKNRTTLEYGSFMPWLDSVIKNREDLVSECDNEVMMEACKQMLNSGVTTFGAISSFGTELEVCTKTPQKVLFFNELIGSQAATADMLYGDFLERLNESKNCVDDGIIPAIAIHSPYSVHPIVTQRAIALAKQEELPLSAHFLESQAEREWLTKETGGFLNFFQNFFSTSKAVTTVEEFMHSLNQVPAHLTHAVQATTEELNFLNEKGHSIAHCPRSNRLLGCGRLAIETLIENNMPFTTATDGLSSNNTLSILDELRAALMLHHSVPIEELASVLIKSITSTPAEIFSLNSGIIEIGKDADFAFLTLPDKPSSLESIALHTILHTNKVDKVYISGNIVS